jgi:RecA-family ATPase
MIAGFLRQEKVVLYVGNEDPMLDITIRVVSRLTGLTKYEIYDDLDGAHQAACAMGYEDLILAPLAPGTPREIEALVTEFKPDVLIIDQLRNLNTGDDHFVQSLEKAATAARNIAKAHDVLVVSATQAGDSATGKKVLDMGDVDSSNTGIPAQADVMIGISDYVDDRGRVTFSLPKNKRSGRHDFFEVEFDTTTSRIRSVD